MWIILMLITLASAQQCPYCEWNACTVNPQGIASCSQCSSGALLQVTTAPSSPFAGYSIGVCQLCATGCQSCQYTLL